MISVFDLEEKEKLEKEKLLLTTIAFFSHNIFNVFLNPLPDDNILGWSKLKQIADNILKCI